MLADIFDRLIGINSNPFIRWRHSLEAVFVNINNQQLGVFIHPCQSQIGALAHILAHFLFSFLFAKTNI